ncbi:EamA family transporter [Actinoallomurus purpureus]|uniref:EamA family transporter n=1 Tax=Actinoallomurus purpureus TaxID=478114 RepID=UPI002091EABE|nr:EamA family transporter [Actinoallomurus purpureus]MCO6010907.1 EamA family transporter [Actinoallomurus purpureus]
MTTRKVVSWSYFMGSALSSYLGPALTMVIFTRLAPAGTAALRIWTGALVLAVWRRPWRTLRDAGPAGRRMILAWGAVLALLNLTFYQAIAILPLGTVAAIEFLPVIGLATFGARTFRNLFAVVAVAGGVAVLTDARMTGSPLGFLFAFADALMFALYIVVAHRAARRLPGRLGGIDGLAAAMLVACVVTVPFAVGEVAPVLSGPRPIGAAVGVGVASVLPYVCDQLAMTRMSRSTYALLLALLPATATVVGIVVLRQWPSLVEAAGLTGVVLGVAVHQHGSDAEIRGDEPLTIREAGSAEPVPADLIGS